MNSIIAICCLTANTLSHASCTMYVDCRYVRHFYFFDICSVADACAKNPFMARKHVEHFELAFFAVHPKPWRDRDSTAFVCRAVFSLFLICTLTESNDCVYLVILCVWERIRFSIRIWPFLLYTNRIHSSVSNKYIFSLEAIADCMAHYSHCV